jgi:hypothetical protein
MPQDKTYDAVLGRILKMLFILGSCDVGIFFLLFGGGVNYIPICGGVALSAGSALYLRRPERALFVLVSCTVGLLLVFAHTLVIDIILPPVALSLIRLKVEPIRFVWQQLNIGLIAMLFWIVFELCRPCVVQNITGAIPRTVPLIGDKFKAKYYVAPAILLSIFLMLLLGPTLTTSLEGKYDVRAMKEAQSRLAGLVKDVDTYVLYVEWTNAAYNSSREGIIVSSKVSAYNGSTLLSLPIEWTEN